LKTDFSKWLRYIVFLVAGFILITAFSGCASTAWKTEARIRHYFGLAPHEPLNSTHIQSALLVQFPVGTPSATVEASLAERGVGKDGKSMMWRPKPNELLPGNRLCCAPSDYEDKLFSVFPMRRITVCFDLDEQLRVKQIRVESFNYGL